MSQIAPYKDLHKEKNGPGDQRPTAMKVVEDQDIIGKWADKTALITGCSSGLGLETARALYATGAKVFITARNVPKGEAVAKSIATGDRSVEVIEMSLDSFASVRAGAAKFLEKSKQLNILINNAGVMACPEGTTQDGFETQFGTNHLGHFLLFQLLQPTLLASATPSFASRVISVSSSGHRFAESIRWDDLDFKKEGYSDFRAYGQSKLANILFANEIDRRFGDKGIHAFSLHPGAIPTELQRHVTNHPLLEQMRQDTDYLAWRKNPEQGAATQVWGAVAKELEGKGGLFLDDVQVAEPFPPEGKFFWHGYAPQAYNKEAEERLWELSLDLTKTR